MFTLPIYEKISNLRTHFNLINAPCSRGGQKVLYAFRVPRQFSTVFGQFYGAESKKVGGIILNSGAKSHFRDLSGRDCA